MPLQARRSIPIPFISLPSLLFTSPTQTLSEKPLFIDVANPETKYLSHHTYRLYSQRLAAGLVSNGFLPGDRLLLYSGNSIYFPAVMMGAIMGRGIFTGANPAYNARELAYQLCDSDAKFLFCAASSLETGIDAATETGMNKERIFVFDDEMDDASPDKVLKGCRHWSALLASVEEGREHAWSPCSTPTECDETITLNYSSGTTGLPKGVEISHRNYVANTLQQTFFWPSEAESRWLCFLPMYHALAQSTFASGAVILQIPVYIMPAFNFVDMLNCVQKFKITYLLLVPPIVVAMAKHPEVKAGRWDLSSVTLTGSGAAPLGKEIIEQFKGLWGGNMRLGQGWGMTELTCGGVSWNHETDYNLSTIGELMPNCEAKIMNDEGTAEVPQGERGEIWYRSPNVMKGYWRNEKATRETKTSDGWLKTGDIAYVDENGFFYIVDRKKELIKVKGSQVAPAELEALLLDHPAVADAAVIGVEKDGDEYPRAYVVLNAGQKASEKDIISFMNTKVSKSKRIGDVRFINAIPKSPSGKILRKVLRDKAKQVDQPMAKL